MLRTLLILMTLMAFLPPAQAQKAQQAQAPQAQNVGDIPFDPALDDPGFHLNDSTRIFQYYNSNSWWLDHKAAYRKTFLDAGRQLPGSQAAQTQTGWLTIRFIVNTSGQCGRFRLLGIDPSYQPFQFDTLSGFYHMTSNNGDYELHIVMALCERALGRYQQSLDYFDKSFGADSTQAGLYGYLYLGTTRLQTKDYRGAIAALEHENRIYDKFAETWYYLAQANLRLGNKALAKEQLQHAKALFADSSGKYYLHDVYCEMFDTVYPEYIDIALTALDQR